MAAICTLCLIAGVLTPGCTQSRAVEMVDDSAASSTGSTELSISDATTTAPADGPDWPAQWASRKFFNRPTAFIYAASAAGAREAEQIMHDAMHDFLEFTGARASKGLIIVTDAKDPLPAEAPELAQIFTNRMRTYQATTQPALTMKWGEDNSDAEWDKQKKKFEVAGLPIEALMRVLPCGVLKDDLSEKLGFPTQVVMQTPWAVIVPTRAACKRSAHELTKAIMKSKDISLGQRLLMAPWLPMMESMMTDELAAERVVALFNEDALSRANWDPSRKQAYIGDYRETKNRERQQRISSHEKDMKAKGAPTSQPVK